MAGPFYVDPDIGHDGNDGLSWAAGHPWATTQKAADTVVAGEICFFRGTETLAAKVDVDTNSGNAAAGSPIRWIGCNAAGEVDGTKFALDADSTVANCLSIDGMHGYIVENFEFLNATGANVAITATASPQYWTFINCDSHDCGSSGWFGFFSGKAFLYSIWFRCRAYNNALAGIYGPYYSILDHCLAIGNGAWGFYLHHASHARACLAHGNSDGGIVSTAASHLIAECVSDGNADGSGIYAPHGGVLAIANRLTSNGTDSAGWGIYGNAATILDFFNFFNGNNNGKRYDGDSVIIHHFAGAETDLDSDDGAQGYEDRANDKFELVPGGAGARVQLALDANNISRFQVGLPGQIRRPVGRAAGV